MTTGDSASTEQIIHNRKPPEAWPGLMAKVMRAQAEPQTERLRIAGLVGDLNSMPRFELDENRYYALGIFICEFAKVLVSITDDKEARQALVEEGATMINDARTTAIQGLRETNPFNALAAEGRRSFDLIAANPVFWPIYDDAKINFPREVSILGACLTRSSQSRSTHHGKSPMQIRKENLEFTHRLFDHDLRDGENHFSFPYLRDQMFAGIGRVEEIIRENHRVEGIRGVIPTDNDIDLLKDGSTLRFFRGIAAGVPLDDFNFGGAFTEHLRLAKAEGRTVLLPFNWRQVKAARQKNRRQKPPRDPIFAPRAEPVICPATTVTRMMPEMIDLGTDMLDRARQMAEAA